MKFAKKPVTIDAVQITPAMAFGDLPLPDGVVIVGFGSRLDNYAEAKAKFLFSCDTIEGTPCLGHIDDWLITGVKGEKYFCQDEIFRQTYEEGGVVALPPFMNNLVTLDLKGKVLVIEDSLSGINTEDLQGLVPLLEHTGAVGIIHLPGAFPGAFSSATPDELAPMAIQLMRAMSSDEARSEFFGELHEEFCSYCGKQQNGVPCQCMES